MRRLISGVTLVALVCLWPDDGVRTQTRGPRTLTIAEVDGHPAVAGEVLVALVPQAPSRAWEEIRQLGDGDLAGGASRSGMRRLRSRSIDTARLRARVAAHPHVRYAEPNWIVRTLSDPGDPLLPNLWGLVNTGQAVNGAPAGVEGADINAAAAWTLSTGSTAHVVGVVDTGIDYTHPDLAPNVWTAPAPFTVTVEGQAVTCPAGSHGFDAIARSCDPMDDHDHGSHAAGTIGAAGANGVGVVGVNWTARLMALRFIDASGSGTTADAIAAIEFAMEARRAFGGTAAADVRVLSNSWGTRAYSQALADTIAAAADENMLFVAAAGNDGFSNDILPLYPASYALANVIAVAATTNTDARAWFSNFGAASVHLGAPGVDILSTIRGGSYGFSSGTSMAAPHVSGAAALVLSRCALDTPSLRQTLLATVERTPALAALTITGGRVDVHGAIRSCIGPPDAPGTLAARGGDGKVDLTWTTAAGATSYSVARALASGGAYSTIASGLTTASFTDTGVVNDTTYFYVVQGSNTFGEGPSSNEASATPKAPADLHVSALTVPSASGDGATISVDVTTRNQGAGAALPSRTRFFFSANTQPDGADAVLGAVDVPALAAGATASAGATLTIPTGVSTDTYYIVALADADDVEAEPSETNNELARSIRIGPDLQVSALTVPATASAGQPLLVTETVRNQGGGAASSTATRFYLSANSTVDASDTLLAGERSVPALGAGASSTGSTTVQLPTSIAPGSYFIVAKADGAGVLLETSESNNTSARTVKIGPDLVISLVAPAVGGAGSSLGVTDTVTNQGTGTAAASATRFYLSSNSTLGEGDVLLAGSRAVGSLAAGASSSGSTTLTLPADLATGSYYILALADADAAVAETSESNNRAARAVAVGPDLRAASMSVPFAQQAGAASTVTLTIENRGGGQAQPSVARFHLSKDTKLDAADVLLEGMAAIGSIPAGGRLVVPAAVTIPAGTPGGTYYVFARVDADDAVVESSESNNTAWRTVSVSVP